MDKQREKLIELFEVIDIEYDDAVKVAKNMLENGVLVPPCMPGDDIWWVNQETNTVECYKRGIRMVCWNGKEWLICDSDSYPEPIGTVWCCLTKEDAEKALKGVE